MWVPTPTFFCKDGSNPDWATCIGGICLNHWTMLSPYCSTPATLRRENPGDDITEHQLNKQMNKPLNCGRDILRNIRYFANGPRRHLLIVLHIISYCYLESIK